ncbi:hypothetical protein F5B21DRAFT_287126 [Xylaria acuta]|nr:hypothetical protein F5B21DRAFT_287126 [Xylaria acuta]
MKFAIVSAAFVAMATAYRCKFDRYATGAPNLLCATFNENPKKGDQTEKDSCVRTSILTRAIPNTTALVATLRANKLIVPCTGGLRATKAEPHSYRVECD